MTTIEIGEARLTTDHPASKGGIPVLVDNRWGNAPVGPDDNIPGGSLLGQEYVTDFYRSGSELPALVHRYLSAAKRPTVATMERLEPGASVRRRIEQVYMAHTLEEGPRGALAWFARRAKLDPSTVQRYVTGEIEMRGPALAVLELLEGSSDR